MRLPWILLLTAIGLSACGDDEPPVPEIEPARELTASEREEAEYAKVIASRPRPMSMKRERDADTGLSVAFPKGWFLDRKASGVFHAWASETRPKGRYVANVRVSLDDWPTMTLDEYVAHLEEEASTHQPDLVRLVSGQRLIGDRTGRVVRYTVPWKQGRLSVEASVFQEGSQFCVVLGSCHEKERPTFASTYTIILQSLQWKKPEAPK